MDERVRFISSATATRYLTTHALLAASLPFAFSMSDVTYYFEHTVPHSRRSQTTVLSFPFVFQECRPAGIPIEPHAIAAKS